MVMSLRSHFKRLARALNQRSVIIEISQIQELGHYDLIGDKHLHPCSCLQDNALGTAI
jgi:hypothetical protein